MFSPQCNFSPIKALEFSCNYTHVQPATANVSPVVSNTLLRDEPFSFCRGRGGKGFCTYQIKVLHKKFKRKKNHAQESTMIKKFKHACSLNFLYEQVFKGQMNQKIDIFSFVALPSPNTKKNHPKWHLDKDFSSQAFNPIQTGGGFSNPPPAKSW